LFWRKRTFWWYWNLETLLNVMIVKNNILIRDRHINRPYISILLPTRKRVDLLQKTLTSIFSLANPEVNNFEVIVKVDLDDFETLDYIKTWDSQIENLHFLISSRKKGYLSLIDFLEDMIDLAKGKYIQVFNDDAIILTPNWNSILESKLTDFKFYYPKINGYKEAFILYSHLNWVGQTLGINEYIEEVEFYQNLELVDETSIDKDNLKFINLTSRDYHMTSPEIKKDIRILKKHLNIEILNPITHL
jgi:hypothetical protein